MPWSIPASVTIEVKRLTELSTADKQGRPSEGAGWTPSRQQSMSRRVLRRFSRHRLAVFGAAIIILLILMAIFAPVIARQDPYHQDYSALKVPPSREHILGTDALGRDMWARLVYATRVSLSVGLVAVAIYTLIGTLLGAIAGYYGARSML